MHVVQKLDPNVAALGEKYFPREVLQYSGSFDEHALRRAFPVRYELFQRELTGKSLISPALIRAKESDLGALNNLHRYLGLHTVDGQGTLREGQLPVFRSLTNFFERGLNSGFVVVPTRGGKTVIFVEMVETVGAKTLVLVPTKDLVKQAQRDFTKFAPLLDVGVYYGSQKDGLDHQVVISTYSSWMSLVKQGTIRPGQFPLIILDEAHEILSSKKSQLIEPFLAQDTVVGFTATDKYSDKKTLLRVLKNQIHRMSINEAVLLNLISPYSVITLETRVDLSQVRTDFARGDYNRSDLAQVLRQPALTRDAILLYKEYFPGQVGLISCSGVEHAKEVAKAFSAAGISAQAVYGEMNDGLREKALAAHQTGELKILTTAKLLTGGYDNYRVRFIFNLEPTMSLKNATQRGGRPLTLDPFDPDKVGVVVEFLHPDASRQRKQMTFLDATLRAFYAGDKKSTAPKIGTPKGRSQRKGSEELKVTIAPDEVEKKIAEHGKGRQSIRRKTDHSSDRINLEIKSLHLERQKVLMSIGATALYMRDTYAERKSVAPNPGALKLYQVAVKQTSARYAQLSSKPADTRRAVQFSIDNREILAHVDRKFRGEGMNVADTVKMRETFRLAREKLNQIFARVREEHGISSTVSMQALFAHIDARCSDRKLPSEALAKMGAIPRDSVLESILKKEIKPIEKSLLSRWDIFLDAMEQIDQLEGQLRLLHQPLLREARAMVKAEAAHFSDRTMSKREILQEAWTIALPIVDQFLVDGSRSRFSTLLGRTLKKELLRAVDEADRAALNISKTSEFAQAQERVREDGQERSRAEDEWLLATFSQDLIFFSELDQPLSGTGEEISEDDYDPEESLSLALDNLSDPDVNLDGTRRQGLFDGDLADLPLLKELRGREREILIARYRDQLTLDECVPIFKITRERVRQIEAKAIRRLQSRLQDPAQIERLGMASFAE